MKITIVRFGRYHHAVSGKLLIDGQLLCGTLENFDKMLPLGDYELGHDGRRLTTPYYVKAKPRVLLSPGNGIEGRKKEGRILLGETLYLGFLVRSQEAYELVTDRLRMQLQSRSRVVKVQILQSEDYFEVA